MHAHTHTHTLWLSELRFFTSGGELNSVKVGSCTTYVYTLVSLFCQCWKCLSKLMFWNYQQLLSCKYSMKVFQLYEAKSCYAYKLEVYCGAHLSDLEHNTSLSMVNQLCEQIKIKIT